MDRKGVVSCPLFFSCVALRKESVDRKLIFPLSRLNSQHVALRKESVDRKFVPFDVIRPAIESLSARRAWIENFWAGEIATLPWSLSARRAWIEKHNRYGRPIDVQRRSPQGERG